MPIVINDVHLQRTLFSLEEDLIDDQLMNRLGLFARVQIQKRTAEGKDVDGNSFRPYSPRYRLFRRATGHQTSPVNLFFSGSMLASMTFEVIGDDTIRLFFMNTTDRKGVRNPSKAFWNNETRNFFALNEDDVDKMTKMVQKRINDIINS